MRAARILLSLAILALFIDESDACFVRGIPLNHAQTNKYSIGIRLHLFVSFFEKLAFLFGSRKKVAPM